MPQLSLYLDESSMEALRRDAARAGKSLSKYAAEKIKAPAADPWPKSFWATYGALTDESFVVTEDPYDADSIVDFG